jgi:guanylate kinase
MKQHEEDEIIAKHRRKKGQKPFVIQRRMTASEADRRIQKEYDRIMKEREWDTTYTKYETEQRAEQALGDIEKKKAHTGGFNHHRGYDHRIIDTREEKVDG